MKYLVLSADKWEFKDEVTGKLNKGVSLWVLNEYKEETDVSVGNKPTKMGCKVELFDELSKHQLPAIYDIDFSTKPGKDGKPTLIITNLKFANFVDAFKSSTVKI